MRNLKRALSLTLASVMLLGMMVVGTSALSFNDADDISNVTAATVLQELDIMVGADGNFMPDAPVTRAQMAKLICVILYGEKLNVSQFSGTTQYSDVPVYEWYNGYVNLATSLGIINGYGDGRFGPDDTVTTAQAALMLCRALGYFKGNEMTGNWGKDSLAAIAQATKLDMFGRLNLATNELLARDNVAEMVFNTMTNAVPVMYSERWGVYYTDSQSILDGVKFNYRNSLAYQNFDLVYDADEADDFYRPATEWGIGTIKQGDDGIDDKGHIAKDGANIKTSIIKAINKAEATYTKAVKLGDIYKDLGLSKAVGQKAVTFWRNGKEEDVTAAGGKIKANDNKTFLDTLGLSKGDDKNKIGGNGVLTQVWYDSDDETAVISMIDTYVGKVGTISNATSASPRAVSINQLKDYTKNLGTALDPKFETENFAAKEVVLYTAAWTGSKYEIQTMSALPTPTTGTLTRWNGKIAGQDENDFSVAGSTYKYSENSVVVDEDEAQRKGVFEFDVDKSELNVYTDQYGYAIYVSGVEGEKNYAAVIGVGQTNPYGDMTNGATLLLTDGTKNAVTAKFKGDKGLWTTVGGDSKNLVNSGEADLASYTVKDDGKHELTALDKYHDVSAQPKTSSTFTNGKSEMVLDGTTLYTTNKTLFFVCTKDGSDMVYNVYVGFEEMPSFDKEVGIFGYAYKTRAEYTTQIEAVYIYADHLAGVSSVDTYFVKKTDAGIEKDKTGTYFILPAIVDGEVTKVKIDADTFYEKFEDFKRDKLGEDKWTKGTANNANTSGVFAIKNVTMDKNNIIDSFTIVNDEVFGMDGKGGGIIDEGTVSPANGVMGIGKTPAGTTQYWRYISDTKGYLVNEDLDKITPFTPFESIGTDTNDTVYAKFDKSNRVDSKTLQDIIIVENNTVEEVPNETEVAVTVTFDKGVKSVTIGSTKITESGKKANVTKNTTASMTIELVDGDTKVVSLTGATGSSNPYSITVAEAPVAVDIKTQSTKGYVLTLKDGKGATLVNVGTDGKNDKATVFEGNVEAKSNGIVNMLDGLSETYNVAAGSKVTIKGGAAIFKTEGTFIVDGVSVTVAADKKSAEFIMPEKAFTIKIGSDAALVDSADAKQDAALFAVHVGTGLTAVGKNTDEQAKIKMLDGQMYAPNGTVLKVTGSRFGVFTDDDTISVETASAKADGAEDVSISAETWPKPVVTVTGVADSGDTVVLKDKATGGSALNPTLASNVVAIVKGTTIYVEAASSKGSAVLIGADADAAKVSTTAYTKDSKGNLPAYQVTSDVTMAGAWKVELGTGVKATVGGKDYTGTVYIQNKLAFDLATDGAKKDDQVVVAGNADTKYGDEVKSVAANDLTADASYVALTKVVLNVDENATIKTSTVDNLGQSSVVEAAKQGATGTKVIGMKEGTPVQVTAGANGEKTIVAETAAEGVAGTSTPGATGSAAKLEATIKDKAVTFKFAG